MSEQESNPYDDVPVEGNVEGEVENDPGEEDVPFDFDADSPTESEADDSDSA